MNNSPLIDKRMFLGSNPLFEDLREEDLGDLVAITHSKQFRSHQTIIKQGRSGDEMYIIVSGKVRIHIHIADGEDLTVGELVAGEAFGEIALFDSETRTATVTTVEPSHFLVLGRDKFKDFLLRHPHVSIQLLTVMSKRLRSSSDLLKDSLYSDVSARLAKTLFDIAQAYGQQTRSGLKVNIAFNDRELGEIAGVPGEVVAAQLRHWKEAGVIQVSHGCLTLLKPEELH